MNDNIKIDVEEVEQQINNGSIVLMTIDYKDEWKTTTCISKTIEELNKCADEFDRELKAIKEYIYSLKRASNKRPPLIDDFDFDNNSKGKNNDNDHNEKLIVDKAIIKIKKATFIYEKDGKKNELELDENTKVTILDDGEVVDGYVKIKLENGLEGYVKADSLVMKSETQFISKAVIKDNLTNVVNLKLGKSDNSMTIRKIEPGEQLDVIGIVEDKKLIKVRTSDGLEGYISKDYLHVYVNDEVV